MTYIWLILVLFLSLIEVLTINLTTIWFVLGGIIAIIISLFTNIFVIQFGTFVITSLIFLIITKKLLKSLIKTDDVKTNIDRIIGMEGIVTEKLSRNKNGAVKVDGKTWTAYSDEAIEENSIVIVLEIKGAKIKVREKVEK